MTRRTTCLTIAVVQLACLATPRLVLAQAYTDITKPLQYRPMSADQTRCDIANLHIHDITDSKGINITATSLAGGGWWYYRSISIRNCLLERINRSEAGAAQGLHTDFIRIAGAADKQAQPTEVLIEDVTLRDGSSLPLLIQDGWFNVTLRRVKVLNTTTSVQICSINTGRFDRITIEDCPGLRVALMGRPGSIGTCTVRNSPGSSIGDTVTKNGRSGAKIVYETAAATPSPATTQPTTKPSPAATQPAPPEDRDLVIQGRKYRVVDAP